MALRAEVLAGNQTIMQEVRVDGTRVTGILEIDIALGIEQINAQATLLCDGRPAWAEENKEVTVDVGYNGFLIRRFMGEVVGIDWENYEPQVAIECRGKLARARERWAAADLSWSNTDDAALIGAILDAYGGLPRRLGSSAWTLGVILPVTLKKGDTGIGLIQEIDRLAGYRTFEAANGTVYRWQSSGVPSAYPAWTFVRGVDILRSRRTRGRDGIINVCTVNGLSYEGFTVTGTAGPTSNPYIPNPPGQIADEIQSNLVETNAKALEIAQREVAERNRRPEGAELEVIGNPLIWPMITAGIEDDSIEIVGGLAHVDQVIDRITHSSYTSTVSLTGGNLSGYNASAPWAVIDLDVWRETQQNADMSLAAVYLGIADGSGSFDPDGSEETLTYAWTFSAAGGTPSPTSATEKVARFTVTGSITSITASLTVTDSAGLTNTDTITKTLVAGELLVEDLWSAEGALVACSDDGQQTWREQAVTSGAATCLCPFGAFWGQIFGATTGRIYASFDKLQTTLTDLGQPNGAVACTAVWIHETSTDRLWAAFADGKVFFSPDRGGTWHLRGTVPGSGSVNEIRESYYQLGALSATRGNVYSTSFDAGASWTAKVTGSGGSTAWRSAGGFGKNAVGLLNDATPLRWEDGGTAPTFPALAPAVTHVRGVSFGWKTKELYAADDQASARLFRSNEALTTFTHTGAAPAPVNQLIRSGNEDGVVYAAAGDGVASTAGILKSLRMETPFYIRRTGTRKVHMVGYGEAHPVSRTTLAPVSTAMPTNTIISDAPNEKVLTLWNGSGNNAPPGGWYLSSFNHAAWPASVAYNTASLDGTTVEMIWDAPARSATEQGLVWREFTLSSGVITDATLSVFCNNRLNAVYLNGTLMTPTSLTTVSNGHYAIYSDLAARLKPGSTNALGIWNENTVGVGLDVNGDNFIEVRYKLKINAAESGGGSAVSPSISAKNDVDRAALVFSQSYDIRQRVLAGGPGTVGHVATDSAHSLFPAVATDPSGNAHAVWDSSESGSRVVRYAKGVWNGSTWVFGASAILANVGSSTGATPSIAVSPNGTVCAVWSDSTSVKAQTWSSSLSAPSGTPVSITPAGLQSSVAADASNVFHIVWNGSFQVQYAQFNGATVSNATSWSDEATGSASPKIAIDAAGNVHMIYGGVGQRVRYRARSAAGTWQAVEDLASGVSPVLAPDSSGSTVHLVFSASYDIKYYTKSYGGAIANLQTLSGGEDTSPAIGVLSSGRVWVVWLGGAGRMYAASKAGGSWSSPALL